MVLNWKLALRKALISAGLALFTQFASLQRWPTFNELWIPLVVAGLAFFTVLENLENPGMTVKYFKLKKKKDDPDNTVLKLKKKKDDPDNTVLKLKKVKRFIAESLVG